MHRTSILSALGIALVIVLGLDYVSLAATGKHLVLGRRNATAGLTSLTRTGPGPVLALNSRPGQPGLRVSSSAIVPRLHADLLDGVHANALRTRAIAYTKGLTAPVASVDVAVDPPPGHYLVSYSAYLVGAARAAVDCYVYSEVDGVSTIVGENRFTAGVSTPGLTGSGLVTKTAGSALGLLCRSGTPFRTSAGQPIQLVLTAVDTVTVGTPGVPRSRPSRP